MATRKNPEGSSNVKALPDNDNQLMIGIEAYTQGVEINDVNADRTAGLPILGRSVSGNHRLIEVYNSGSDVYLANERGSVNNAFVENRRCDFRTFNHFAVERLVAEHTITYKDESGLAPLSFPATRVGSDGVEYSQFVVTSSYAEEQPGLYLFRNDNIPDKKAQVSKWYFSLGQGKLTQEIEETLGETVYTEASISTKIQSLEWSSRNIHLPRHGNPLQGPVDKYVYVKQVPNPESFVVATGYQAAHDDASTYLDANSFMTSSRIDIVKYMEKGTGEILRHPNYNHTYASSGVIEIAHRREMLYGDWVYLTSQRWPQANWIGYASKEKQGDVYENSFDVRERNYAANEFEDRGTPYTHDARKGIVGDLGLSANGFPLSQGDPYRPATKAVAEITITSAPPIGSSFTLKTTDNTSLTLTAVGSFYTSSTNFYSGPAPSHIRGTIISSIVASLGSKVSVSVDYSRNGTTGVIVIEQTQSGKNGNTTITTDIDSNDIEFKNFTGGGDESKDSDANKFLDEEWYEVEDNLTIEPWVDRKFQDLLFIEPDIANVLTYPPDMPYDSMKQNLTGSLNNDDDWILDRVYMCTGFEGNNLERRTSILYRDLKR